MVFTRSHDSRGNAYRSQSNKPKAYSFHLSWGGMHTEANKKGVRHSFMHFLSFILISLFLFFTRSTSPEVECIQKPQKGVSGTLLCIFKKGCQALFCAFSYFYLNLFSSTKKGCQALFKIRVSGTLLCIFLVLS